jgi:hypothetical protein
MPAKKKTAKKAVKKRKRTTRAEPPIVGVHNIDVSDGRNAVVTTNPPNQSFRRILFTSNRVDTGIRYTDSSPFPEAKAGKPFRIGLGKGPFNCVIVAADSTFHFECGHFLSDDDKSFSPWGGGGADTSVGR